MLIPYYYYLNILTFNLFSILKGMDIPDIELVVVYGSPKTTSELYQVLV